MAEILTIGEILVEVMTKSVGQKFSETGDLIGPFPSGAPAIFTDQAAKIGSRAGIFACVGKDAFGELNCNKLKSDGVDVSRIKITESASTGVAFVTYMEDGDRDFIFHIHNSAAGLFTADDLDEAAFEDCNFFHIMGTALYNEEMIQSAKKGIEICKRRGIKVSFDPNIRKELLTNPRTKQALFEVFAECDIFMPSHQELALFAAGTEAEAVQTILSQGKEYVVIKKGNRGCAGYSKEESFDIAPIQVEEIDPTGAGDCFGGAWIACRQLGFDAHRALQYANACGALAVTRRGPMEGTSRLAEIEAFIQRHDMSIREAAQ